MYAYKGLQDLNSFENVKSLEFFVIKNEAGRMWRLSTELVVYELSFTSVYLLLKRCWRVCGFCGECDDFGIFFSSISLRVWSVTAAAQKYTKYSRTYTHYYIYILWLLLILLCVTTLYCASRYIIITQYNTTKKVEMFYWPQVVGRSTPAV